MKPVELRPDQEELVETLLRSQVPARHVLVAPTGTGKTTTMVEVVKRLADSDPDFRALIVFDSRVAGENFLARAGAAAQLTERLLDKRWLRAASGSVGMQHWPAALVAGVAARDLRDDWARRALAATRWSLIIIDEPTRAAWLGDWIDVIDAQRKVVLTSTAPTEFRTTGWSVTRWPLESSVWSQRRVEHVPVPFERSKEEQALLHEVRDAVARVSEHSEWGALELQQAAESSPFALQAAALRLSERLRPLRNSLAHGRTGRQEELADDRQEDLTSLLLYFSALERIIDAVDRLDVDARFQAFLELVIDRLTPGGKPFVVFTSEPRTADYLLDRLRFMQREAEAIRTGWVPPDAWPDRPVAYVVADDAIAGLDLGDSSTAVFYDLPHDSAAERESRLSPKDDLTIFVLDEAQDISANRSALAKNRDQSP